MFNMKNQKKQIARLNRVKGQIEGVVKMIEADKDCTEVLNQLTAIYNAIASARTEILSNHLESCIMDVVEKKQADGKEKILQLMDLLKRF